MKASFCRAMARKISAAVLMTTLASSVIFCLPTTSSSATTPASITRSQSASSSTTVAAAAAAAASSTSASNSAAGRQLSSLATELRSMPSLVSLRDASKSQGASSSSPVILSASTSDDELNTFDGKNPFSDDSLWQIPINLVRDVSASAPSTGGASGDSMAKSASEMSSAAKSNYAGLNDDDESDAMDDDSTSSVQQQQQQLQPSASNSPTIISASTDLKTAAGYHHASPSHYGADSHHDHYGKYFQYASVPYPYAWDFGYRRGNPYHTIERYEHGKGPHFQTKVKWSDKYGGHGVHVWDYNHDDHSSHHYGGDHHDEHHGYEGSHAPAHYGSGHHGGSGHGGHHYGGGHH